MANPLHPDPNIQKALISTTSRFVGEYKNENLLITHAWPDIYKSGLTQRFNEGPASRSAFVAVFRTPPPSEPKPGLVIPNYGPTGDLICAQLSILFGKRFDFHGLIEGSGFFQIPDLSEFNHLCLPQMAQNSHAPRKDLEIPLRLEEVARIEPVLFNKNPNQHFLRTIKTAGKFYQLALQSAERDPEIAYLHLITVGEILSNFFKYDKDELLDENTKGLLVKIESELNEGSDIARQIKGKLLHVKRRFIKTICRLVNDDLFKNSESSDHFSVLKQDDFEDRIKAAYNLRSLYVHAGTPFGMWTSLHMGSVRPEIQSGKPIVSDAELGKVLAKAPTYCGLERIMRFCLLRFIHTNGVFIDEKLEDSTIATT